MSLVLAAGTVGVVASPAFAAGYAGCRDARKACLWEDRGWSGSTYGEQSQPGTYELGGFNGDNEITSFVNFTPFCLALYDGDNLTGSSKLFPKFTGTNESAVVVDNLGDYSFDNKAESWLLYRC